MKRVNITHMQNLGLKETYQEKEKHSWGGHRSIKCVVTTKWGSQEAEYWVRTTLLSSFTRTKLWARRGKPLCHDWTLKGTGAGVETGSVSLYGLKPASLDFHPPPTYTSSVSQQVIQLPFPVLHSLRPLQTAGKQPANLLTNQGNVQAARQLPDLPNAYALTRSGNQCCSKLFKMFTMQHLFQLFGNKPHTS